MAYPERQIEKIIKMFCKENGVDFVQMADGWLFVLKNGKTKSFVMGYKFDINNSISASICDDKSALSSVLVDAGINCVEHHFYEAPNGHSKPKEQIFDELEILLKTHGELVIKPNIGSGGKNVVRCNDLSSLNELAEKYLKSKRAFSVCKFENIKNEYRVICLCGEVQLVYRKQRPFVVGDGKSSIQSLISQKFKDDFEFDALLNVSYVPKKGEVIQVSWKHNLGLGATADTNVDENLKEKLSNFAKRVAEEININFASVDVIELDDGSFKVLEINSGVMMEKFASLSDENFEKAKSIYFKALKKCLKIK